jgi:hypothetical protein
MTSDTTSHLNLTLMVAEGQGDLPRTRRAPRIDKTGSGGIHMGRWRTLVAVEVRNDGDKSHNFTIEGLHVGTGAMHHGDVKTVTFTAPKGSMEFSCTWHRGMVGRMVAT